MRQILGLLLIVTSFWIGSVYATEFDASSRMRAEFSQKCHSEKPDKNKIIFEGFSPIESKECLPFFVKNSNIIDRFYKFSYLNFASLGVVKKTENSFCHDYFVAGLRISNEFSGLMMGLGKNPNDSIYRARFEIFYHLLESYFLVTQSEAVKQCILVANKSSHRYVSDYLKALTNHAASIIRVKWGRRGFNNAYILSTSLSKMMEDRSLAHQIWDGFLAIPDVYWGEEVDYAGRISSSLKTKEEFHNLFLTSIAISNIPYNSPYLYFDLINKIESRYFKILACEAKKSRGLIQPVSCHN